MQGVNDAAERLNELYRGLHDPESLNGEPAAV
jgi:hypothetical protein